MSKAGGLFDDIIEEKLLSMHTCFIGRIVSFSPATRTATVQPLTQMKQLGKNAQPQAIQKNLPVLHNAMYKLYWYYNTCLKDGNQGCSCDLGSGAVSCSCQPEQRLHVGMRYIQAGDICVCVTAERDIADAKKGVSSVPHLGHHNMKDSVVVGILGQDVPEYTTDPPMVK